MIKKEIDWIFDKEEEPPLKKGDKFDYINDIDVNIPYKKSFKIKVKIRKKYKI